MISRRFAVASIAVAILLTSQGVFAQIVLHSWRLITGSPATELVHVEDYEGLMTVGSVYSCRKGSGDVTARVIGIYADNSTPDAVAIAEEFGPMFAWKHNVKCDSACNAAQSRSYVGIGSDFNKSTKMSIGTAKYRDASDFLKALLEGQKLEGDSSFSEDEKKANLARLNSFVKLCGLKN